jgi:tetratricopeptide (TPR) repeat protein
MLRSARIAILFLCLAAAAGCSGSSTPGTVAEATPEPIPIAEITDAATAIAEGNRYLDQGDTLKALEAFDRAVAIDPDAGEAWFKMGIAYSLVEARDQSVDTVETPLPGEKREEKKPNSVIAFERAVKAYKKAVAANDEDHVSYFNLGRAYNKLNEDEDAEKALRQAVKIKDDDSEYQTELGAILIKLAEYHQAIPPLKKAIELDAGNNRAIELLEKAEAGARRIDFAQPKPDNTNGKRAANTNANANSGTPPANTGKPPVGNSTVRKPPPPPANRPN